jgi:FixJ family two-component response regulator
VCPGTLCTALFRYFEQESSPVHCAGVRQRIGFTRREQQFIPLIAKGMTNKESANHFCLSEQTVKNHLVPHETQDRGGRPPKYQQRYRTLGFLL